MQKEKKPDVLSRLEAGYSLPTLSPVALRLVELATDDCCSAKNLAGLIEKDPPLTVRLLKVANSAFFRSTTPVTTINQAVVKIGFHRLRMMALSISLRDNFPFGKMGPLDYEQFWRISLYRGLIAKSLADRLGTYNPEEAFIAGFIMEIGLLIFFDIFLKGKSDQTDLNLEPLEDLLTWEKTHYGVNHRQVGEAALRYWQFPEPIIHCQTAGTTPGGSQHHLPIIRLCEQARVLSRILYRTSEDFYGPFEEAQKSLGVERTTINDIIVATLDEVQDIADSLHVKRDEEKDIIEIVENANRALYKISEKIYQFGRPAESGFLPSFDSLKGDHGSFLDMLQAVAHEIRNPLLAVGGFARKLASSLDPDSDGGKYVRIILEEASKLEKALSEMIRVVDTQ